MPRLENLPRTGDFGDGCERPKTIVSFLLPNDIFWCSEIFLGYSAHELVCQSISCIFGPRTEIEPLRRSINAAASFQTTCIQVWLYDRDRCERYYEVTVCPWVRSGLAVGCILDLKEKSTRLCQEMPRRLETQDGNSIHELTFKPHNAALNDLDDLLPIAPDSNESPRSAIHWPPFEPNTKHTTSNSQESQHLASSPTTSMFVRVIHPRCKGHAAATDDAATGCRKPPVAVTPEVIRALRGQSVGAAAAALGVSPTAFKRACRKLGLRRWDYARGRAARAAGKAAAAEETNAAAIVAAAWAAVLPPGSDGGRAGPGLYGFSPAAAFQAVPYDSDTCFEEQQRPSPPPQAQLEPAVPRLWSECPGSESRWPSEGDLEALEEPAGAAPAPDSTAFISQDTEWCKACGGCCCCCCWPDAASDSDGVWGGDLFGVALDAELPPQADDRDCSALLLF
jgi:hypothetical protein